MISTLFQSKPANETHSVSVKYKSMRRGCYTHEVRERGGRGDEERAYGSSKGRAKGRGKGGERKGGEDKGGRGERSWGERWM